MRGMEIVGAPVGAPAFCEDFVKRTLEFMLRQSEELLKLHPQCATKILKDCVSAAPAYLAQVCHPAVTKEYMGNFDKRVWDLWVNVIGGVGDKSPGCCTLSLERSRMKAFLPSRLNGVGLRSWDRTADFAWFASVACCIALEDEDFNRARRFLHKQGASAYEIALEAVGGPAYLEKIDYEILPIGEPEVLSDSTFFIDLFKTHPNIRLQKEMLNLANLVAHKDFLNYVEHSDTSEQIMIESMKRPNQSLLATMFTANLMQHDVRVTKAEFTAAARQYVCLPPLSNGTGALTDYVCGCEIQHCANPKCTAPTKNLDAMGNHGLVCHPGVKALRATLFERAIESCFRLAGGNPVRQPQTYSLLGEVFPKEDLTKLFPGKLSKKESHKRKNLAMRYLDIINEIPRGQVRTAELAMLREEYPDDEDKKQREDDDKGSSVIRFDLKLSTSTPIEKPREYWIDHAIVQETSPTHAMETLKHLEAKNTNLIETSPAFQKTYGAKQRGYSALLDVLNRLKEERKLKSQPEILFPVVSSLGYMNADMAKLIKLITQFQKANLSKAPRADGLGPKDLKGRFKVRMRNTLCFALVRANALSIVNQGEKDGVTHPS